MLKLALLFVFFAHIHSNPLPAQVDQCKTILETAGVTERYDEHVAHAIHSLSLRELRKFEPTAKKENNIPTINLDLSSKEPILKTVPELQGPHNDQFLTEGMKVLDSVLAHLGDKNWGIARYSDVDKIAHAFHMAETWEVARQAYVRIKMDPPAAAVCQCAVQKNNVMEKLQANLKQISGLTTKGMPMYAAVFPENTEEVPTLKVPKDWEKWTQLMRGHDREKVAHDAALYLYCMLN